MLVISTDSVFLFAILILNIPLIGKWFNEHHKHGIKLQNFVITPKSFGRHLKVQILTLLYICRLH
jgi:hypothetical protein